MRQTSASTRTTLESWVKNKHSGARKRIPLIALLVFVLWKTPFFVLSHFNQQHRPASFPTKNCPVEKPQNRVKRNPAIGICSPSKVFRTSIQHVIERVCHPVGAQEPLSCDLRLIKIVQKETENAWGVLGTKLSFSRKKINLLIFGSGNPHQNPGSEHGMHVVCCR